MKTDQNAQIPPEIFDPLLDDINTPGYIANLHQLYSQAAKGKEQDKILFNKACNFIGLLLEDQDKWESYKKASSKISEDEILNKIEERNNARKSKNYKLADQIRKELFDKGILIEDKDDTTTWKYK